MNWFKKSKPFPFLAELAKLFDLPKDVADGDIFDVVASHRRAIIGLANMLDLRPGWNVEGVILAIRSLLGKSAEPTVDRAPIAAELEALMPRPVPLPALGSEPLVASSMRFAHILLLYVASRNIPLTSQGEIEDAAREATLWYYGVSS